MTKLERLTITDEDLNGLPLNEFLNTTFGDPTPNEEFENGDDADIMYVIEIEKEKKNG